MNNNIKWKLKEIGKGKIRIELDQFSKIPTIEEYKEIIGNLLGIDDLESDKKLIDESNSAFIGDNLLLYSELKNFKYEEVTFSGPNGDIVVNSRNFEEVFDKSENDKDTNKEAINDAVAELWTRG